MTTTIASKTPVDDRRTLTASAVLVAASIPAFFVIFTLWGQAGLSQDDSRDPLKVAAFATEHRGLYAALPVTGVIMHLAALLLVLGFHRRATPGCLLSAAGTVLGLFWIGADLMQNLMHYNAFVGGTQDITAVDATTNALWHAGHMGGGLWILSLALREQFSKPYKLVCAIVGTCFAAHPFVYPLAAWWFSLELIAVPIWAIWTAAGPARSTAAATSDGSRASDVSLSRALPQS